jgi:hypothetical protein
VQRHSTLHCAAVNTDVDSLEAWVITSEGSWPCMYYP